MSRNLRFRPSSLRIVRFSCPRHNKFATRAAILSAPERNQTRNAVRAADPGGVETDRRRSVSGNGPRRSFSWDTGGMYTVELYARVRRAVQVEGKSERQMARKYGLGR